MSNKLANSISKMVVNHAEDSVVSLTDAILWFSSSGLTENNWIIDSYFTYKTPAERDQLLQQILNLWKTVFGTSSLVDDVGE